MSTPTVSIIVPVHNAMPYLLTCLSSIMEQTLDASALEVITVDDGSTDGSSEQLDVLARTWPRLRVVHQAHSGGASRPRNVALDLAAGRYVYFLDADDYLGAEALARMVSVAEEQGSDVVVGQRKAVGGRKGITGPRDHVPLLAQQRHDGLTADDYDAVVARASAKQAHTPLLLALANACHLFRRDRIDRLGLRFREDLNIGEDCMFSDAFVDADTTVGIVDGYDCHYERLRADGANISTKLIGTEMHIDKIALQLSAMSHRKALRWRWDQFLREGILELTQQTFNATFAARPSEVRQRLMGRARDFLATWPRLRGAPLPALDRLKIYLINHGMERQLAQMVRTLASGGADKEVCCNGRVYGGYPYFRDPALDVPDDCYDVTDELAVRHELSAARWDGGRLSLAGHAYLDRVDTAAVSTALVLRDRLGRTELRWPTQQVHSPWLTAERGHGRYNYDHAGFEIDLDFADIDTGRPLQPGTWRAFLAVGAQDVNKEVPLGGNRNASVDGAISRSAFESNGSGRPSVAAYFTKYGTLTLEVGP